jgi:hypothetical protein
LQSQSALAASQTLILADAMRAEGIPLELADVLDLSVEVSTGSVSDTLRDQIFVYPMLAEGNFYLFQRVEGKWRGGKRNFAEINSFVWGGNRGSEITLDCEDGGGVFIGSTPSFLVLNRRMGPSASCILLLTPDLKPVAKIGALDVIELSPKQLLVRSNIVQSAPTSPLGLWRYTIGVGATRLYPTEPHGRLRSAYVRTLNASQDACEQKPDCRRIIAKANFHLDGDAITEYATHYYSSQLDALTLRVRAEEYSLNHVLKRAGVTTFPEQNWVYVFHQLRSTPRWVEFSEKDFVLQFGEQALKAAPTAEMIRALFVK